MDSNVLVYAVDAREAIKTGIANRLVEILIETSRIAVTPQILAEFFDVTTRPKGILPPIFSRAQAAENVDRLLLSCACIDVTPVMIGEAVRCSRDYGLRVFDALIWAAAKWTSVSAILSEDVLSLRPLEGVRYINPFERSFELADIGL